MMRRPARSRRRRARPRTRDPLPLDKALAIIELLAEHPAGLTIHEIAARVEAPAVDVIRTIAVLQRRHWLHVAPGNEGVGLGPRMIEMTEGRQET